MAEQHKSMCLLCSIGCGCIVETHFDEAVNLEYDLDDPAGRGKLCSKGNYILELINHPMRLVDPRFEGKVIGWKDALKKIGSELSSHLEKSEVGLILGGDASTEDAVTARLFAEKCLGNGRLAIHFATDDDEVLRALAASSIPNPSASLDDIEKSGCTIAVGDPFEVGPVIAGRALNAKHVKRGNRLAVISNKPNRTSRFASLNLIEPVRKTLAQLLRAVVEKSDNDNTGFKQTIINTYPATDNPAVAKLAEQFVKTPSSVIILETQDPVAARLAAAVVAAGGNDKRLYVMNTYGNAAGICDVIGDTEQGANGNVEDIINAAEQGELKALFVLGADIVKGVSGHDVGSALEKIDCLIAGAPFENGTTQKAGTVLPTTLWLEAEGTYNGKFMKPVIEPPGNALPYGEILRLLAEEMGSSLPPVSIETVLSRKELTEDAVRSLLKDIEADAPEPAFRSTVIKYADGSLTDNMSWIQMQERNPW